MIENLQWTGMLGAEVDPLVLEFLGQGGLPGCPVIWWLEPPLLADEPRLMISHALSGADPIRVDPGGWVHFDGARYGPGRRAGVK